MESKITLRAARKADQPGIRSLVWGSRLNPTNLNWRRFIVGVDSSGVLIACAQIKTHRDGSHELASLVVSPDHRGQGIGRFVLEHLIRNHVGDLYLMCRSSLGVFYRKFGFQLVTETLMPPYFRRLSRLSSLAEFLREEGESLLIMHLDVDRWSGREQVPRD
jgi:N-acetylglutamate synthase-like GNAT family acetyltransferase